MHADRLSKDWIEYRAREVDQTIHPSDHMYNTAVNGWSDYNFVGLSAVQMISAARHHVPWHDLARVLDFGCGHGRVARHLRTYLPKADFHFADIDPTCPEFCAATFNGTGIVTTEDFSAMRLPGDMDLVWVGSVFTHLDQARTHALFDALIGTLRPKGILVATFRGAHMYHDHQHQSPQQREKWKQLMADYEASGFGYAPYDSKNPQWGLSLSTVARVVALGQRHENVRLVGYTEVGWASVHDVGVWMKLP